MTDALLNLSRRAFMNRALFSAAMFATPGAFAELLTSTPSQTEGPFYPNELPLDTDNDLLVINDNITPSVGEITHLNGRILDERGNPGFIGPVYALDSRSFRIARTGQTDV